jgi:hypothetical protein
MTWRTIERTVRVPERAKRATLDRVCERGPIIVIHAAGTFARTNGALFTTALVAMPGESTDECLARYGIRPNGDDLVFNFAFDPLPENSNE